MARTSDSDATSLTKNETAYRYYLEAKHNADLGARTSGNIDRGRVWPLAVQLYEKAIEHDPGFARAYAELAFTHLRIHWFGAHRGADHVTPAWTALAEALRLAPDDPEVWRVRGFYYFWGERDYHRALREFLAVQRLLLDDASIAFVIAGVQRRTGKFQEAVRVFERALSIDDSDPFYHSTLCETYLGLRRFAQAERCFQHVIRMAPERVYTHKYLMGTNLAWRGDTTRARRVLEDAAQHVSMREMADAWARLALLRRDYRAALDYSNLTGESVMGQLNLALTLPDIRYAQLYGLLGYTTRSRAHYEAGLRKLESTTIPHELGAEHHALAYLYAGLGRPTHCGKPAQRRH